MENSSGVSSPRNSGMEEVEEEESGWTQYFVHYEIRRMQEEEEEDNDLEMSNSTSMMSCSASMASDAGSGPEWKLRPIMNSIPKRLNMNKAANYMNMPPYDDSLKDTASSPVNSPKINNYFKRMDISCRRSEETFDTTYLGKERVKCGGHEGYNVAMKRTRNLINGFDEPSKELEDKDYCFGTD